MTSATRKLLAWVAMAATTGGTALFAFVVIEYGFPTGREIWLNLWPLGTGLGMILSLFLLRRVYREQPSSGFWHVSIRDLLTVTLTFGALLGITERVCIELGVAQKIFLSALIAGVTLVGLLVANRLGIRERRRYLFGIAFALGTTGLLIIGALLTFIVVALLVDRNPSIISDILSEGWRRSATFRAAAVSLIVCLPAVGLCYQMSNDAKEAAESL